MFRKDFFILIIFFILFTGCIGEKEEKIRYVCPDGSIASNPEYCQLEEPEKITVTKYVCYDGKIADNAEECEILKENLETKTLVTTTMETTTTAELSTTVGETTTTREEITSTVKESTTTTTTPKTTTTSSTIQTTISSTTTILMTSTIETSQNIEISATQFKTPSGNDREYLNEEWVEITNGKSFDIDMTNWTLEDEAAHVYTFPSGFVLSSSNSVKVHTGSGTDTNTDLYWNSGSPIWNNDEDTATLKDNEGKIIDQRSE